MSFFSVNYFWIIYPLIISCVTPGFGQFRQSQPPSSSSVSCPERNGRFIVPSQCDAYVECSDGAGEQKLCPDGLLFNSKASFFAYPCQYPAEVDCEGRSGLQPAQPTENCPHQFGYYREGDAQHCGQFKICSNGQGYIFDCPEGLAFNEYSLRCDWPDQVESCNAEAFLGFTCPNAGSQNTIFSPDGYQFFRHPSDCSRYFICINGRPRLFTCGEGKAFNELINSCDGAENVTGCYSTNLQSSPNQFGGQIKQPQSNQFGPPRSQFRAQREDAYSNLPHGSNKLGSYSQQNSPGPERVNLFTNSFLQNRIN